MKPTLNELDAACKAQGLLTIDEMMQGQPLDAFMSNVAVIDLQSFLAWVEQERRTYLGMKLRHDTGLHVLGDDTLDFILGKSAILWECHMNIKKVIDYAT